MTILGNFYRIREKGDESIPEKDSIIKINKYENKVYYYEIVNGIFYFNQRFKEDSQFLKFCDKVDIESIQQFLPENPEDKIKSNVIPEYVEYIDTKYKGQIVKVEEWKCGSYCKVIFHDGDREQPFKHLVKPSTKEEYEAQNKSKQLTVDDLIRDEIYVFDIKNTKNFISKFKNKDSSNYYDSYYIQGDEFNDEPESALISSISNLRLATSEEKKWLNTCITQDKFIPKEDLCLYDDLGYLIKKCEECNDTGKVMKAKLYPSGHTEIWEDCEKCQKKEIMFKKGDYIVCLNELSTKEGKMNFCYKLIEDQKKLNNEESHLFFEKWKAISIPQHQVRYATSKEIIEFERLGQPFDVSKLIKKVEESLIGRYVKYINNTFGNPEYGDYFRIDSMDEKGLFRMKDKEKSCYWDSKSVLEGTSLVWELMPIGFEPSNEEWIPKVGDWCILEHYHTSYWFKGKLFQIGSIINGHIHPMVNNKPDLSASFMITGIFKDCRPALPHEIPINSDCIIYNGQDISKGLEVSQYYEFDENNYSKEIHIPVINKRKIEKQLITIESSPYLELNLKKIKTKQIQTIKI